MNPSVPSAALEGLLYAILALSPFAFGAVEAWPQALLQALCFLLAFGVLLRGRRAASKVAGLLWLAPAAVALLGLCQDFGPRAPDGPWPLGPFTAAPHATARAVTAWAAHAALLWSVPRILTGPDAARRFARVLFITGAGVAILGLLQAATGGGRIYWLRLVPENAAYFGPFYNKDHAANFLLLAFGAGLGVLFSRARGWNAGWPQAGWVREQLAWAAAAACVLAALFVSRSRGAALALGAGAAVLAVIRAGFIKDGTQRAAAVAAGSAGAALAAVLALRHVMAGVDAGGPLDGSVAARLAIYADSWDWWLSAPFFGTGLGSFSAVYPYFQDSALRGLVLHAHSDWLEFALEGGLAALCVLAAGAGAAVWAGASAWRRAGSSEMSALIGGLLGAALCVGAHAFIDFSFQIPANAAATVAVLGALTSAWSWKDKGSRQPPSEPPALSETALVFALLAVGIASALQPAISWSRARGGESAGARAAAYSRALSGDDDPAHWRGLAAAAHALSKDRPDPDAEVARFALSAALRAANARPFDDKTLYLAGSILWGLGRTEDGGELIDRSRKVSFGPYRPRPPRSGAKMRRVERARALGLWPAKERR